MTGYGRPQKAMACPTGEGAEGKFMGQAGFVGGFEEAGA